MDHNCRSSKSFITNLIVRTDIIFWLVIMNNIFGEIKFTSRVSDDSGSAVSTSLFSANPIFSTL